MEILNKVDLFIMYYVILQEVDIRLVVFLVVVVFVVLIYVIKNFNNGNIRGVIGSINFVVLGSQQEIN